MVKNFGGNKSKKMGRKFVKEQADHGVGLKTRLSEDPCEVYAAVAYILYSNDLIDEDFVLSNESFFDVEMPNANGFIIDDRTTSEAHFWNKQVCMANCKSDVKITMRAAVLDVTPEDE